MGGIINDLYADKDCSADFALPLVTLAALVQPREALLDASTLASAASAVSIPSPQKARKAPGSFFVLPANATGAFVPC